MSGTAPTAAESHAFSGAPVIATEAVELCAICGARETTEFARGRDYEMRTCANEWVFVQCAGCGHVWLNPRPAVAELGTIYPRDYYAYDYEARVHPIARRGKAALDALKLGAILRRIGRTPATFLDIGCGSGRYLRTMAARGLRREDIHGLELDPAVVDRLAAEGFSVACARVEDATLAPRSLDLVTMFHVLEHVDAPDRVVARVAEWLAPGGVFAIETPNLDALDQRLFAERHWGGYHIPRHWHLFTPETLARLLRGAGLTPIATMYQTGHSFWMHSIHHRLRYGARPRPRLARFFDPYRNVVPLAAFTALDKARAFVGARTSAMLMLALRSA